jgi:hypothetical protein
MPCDAHDSANYRCHGQGVASSRESFTLFFVEFQFFLSPGCSGFCLKSSQSTNNANPTTNRPITRICGKAEDMAKLLFFGFFSP